MRFMVSEVGPAKGGSMNLAALEDFRSLMEEWVEKLLVLSPKFKDHPTAKPVDPRSTQPGVKKKKPILKTKLDDQSITEDESTKQNTPSINRFSLSEGEDVLYDGESQTMLCDFWTALNLGRGALRKDTTFLRRAKTYNLPMANYKYSGEEIHSSDDLLEVDDESDEESNEQRRIEEERQQAIQRDYVRKLMVLERVNSSVECALAACEAAAYLWLKGLGCAGHVVYIISQLTTAIDRINTEKKAKAAEIAEDEGLGTDLEATRCSPESEPHLKADLHAYKVPSAMIGKRARSPGASSFPRKRGQEVHS